MGNGSHRDGPTDELRHGFTIGDIRVDPHALELSNEDGARTALSDATMDLLLLLAEKQPHSVTKTEILESFGGENPQRLVEESIGELNDAIVGDLNRPGYVEVFEDHLRLAQRVELAGRGRFPGLVALWQEIRKRRVFRVATTYALITFILLQVADAMLDTLPIPPNFFPIMLAVLAIGFPVVILLGWFFEITPQGIFLDRRRTNRVINRTVAVAGMVFLAGIAIGFAFAVFSVSDFRPKRDDVAIAVLPFDNMTGDPADQDICDGIVEELLNELTHLKELRVVGRKASFYYRDRNEDWKTIADKLGASMIIEGSVRRNANSLRIAAQLIDRAGFHLWSDTFDAPVGRALDILAIQRSIAQQVVDELPIRPSAESRQALGQSPTTNEKAYQLYMQGRKYLRDADQIQRFESAETLFRDALEADPDFVDALSGLCETQALIYQRTQRPTDYARAAATCTRLITRDGLNAEGLVALGTLNRLSGNYAEAKTLFDRALEASPMFEPALYGLARALEGLGEYDDAEQYYIQSLELDPGYWQVYIGYGRYLERGGRYADAIEQYKQVIRLTPDNVAGYGNLGAAYFDNDQWEEALNAWQAGIDIHPDPIGYLNLGTAQYYLGDFQAAEQSFSAGIGLRPDFYPLWGKLGAALERLDRKDESRNAFEKAMEFSRAVIEINEKDSRAMYYLASYLAHLGRFEEARKWSTKARETSPRDPAGHYFAAIVASLAGDDEEAVDALAEALRLGYSVKIIRQDTYFQAYLDSAKLAAWMPGEV